MTAPATSRPKCNPIAGCLPVLQYCPVEQLQIDAAYQRGMEAGSSVTLIRRIAIYWDWGLCQPLFVARRSNGGLFVVDGQHRLAAARLRGDIWQLPCVVREFASAAGEAASFVALNQERRPLTKLDLFKAAIAAGDQEAKVILAALERAGLGLGHSNNKDLKPGTVNNIGGLQAALRGKGLEAFDVALLLLAESFSGQVLRFAGTLFPGIAHIAAIELGRTPDLMGRGGVLLDTMIACVGGASQEEWVTDITRRQAAEGATFSRREAAIRVLAEAWEECRAELLDDVPQSQRAAA